MPHPIIVHRITAIILLAISVVPLAGQIRWGAKPENLQFIPRNPSTNRGTLSLRGEVITTGYSSLEVRFYRNGVYAFSNNTTLSYSGGVAPFSMNVPLASGRFMYTTEVVLKNAVSSNTVYTAKGIAVGDAYLISGQSNSVANRYNGSANPGYQDSLIRSFGSSAPNAAAATADTGWYVADGDGLYNRGCIGQWGLVMARKLVDSLGVPVCIINAGVGGTPIAFHQKSKINPYDPNTNYGRMLTRSEKSGLRSYIRGILWFQGESDGANAALHDSLFRVMHLDWLRDYPAIRKIYVVQVRSGCGSPTLQLREKQRLMGNLSKCVAFTANGLNSHDGCHYWFVNGYEQLGLQLYRAVATDIYGRPFVPANYPLHPLRAWYSKGDRTEICVEFRGEPTAISADTLFHSLFRLEGGTAVITSGRARQGRVYLTLSSADCNIRGISYDGLPGNRPWVKTTAGVALMSFYNMPVYRTFIPETAHACEGSDARLGRDSIPGYTYQWTGLGTGRTSFMARPVFRADRNEKFRLITRSSSGSCAADTAYQMLFADSIPVSTLPRDTGFCSGTGLSVRPLIKPLTSSVSWVFKDSLIASVKQLNLTSSGKYILRMVSPAGCFRADTINVRMFPPLSSPLADSYTICSGQDTLLTANPAAVKVIWNFTDSSRSFRPGIGQDFVILRQSDSNHCVYADTAGLTWHSPRPLPLDSVYHICPADSQRINLPGIYHNWFYRNKAIKDRLMIYRGASGLLTATDSTGCPVKMNIRVAENPVPEFRFSDTATCEGEDIVLGAPLRTGQYLWSNGSIRPETILDEPGYYWLKVTNDEGCSYTDTVRVKHYPRTTLNGPADTFFCTGDSFVLRRDISHAQQLWVNGEPWSRSISLKQPGEFRLTHFDMFECRTEVNLRVFERTCLNSRSDNGREIVRIKCSDHRLLISGLPSGTRQLRVFDGSGRTLISKAVGENDREVQLDLPAYSMQCIWVQACVSYADGQNRCFTIKTMLTD